jgi:hypothetical protein
VEKREEECRRVQKSAEECRRVQKSAEECRSVKRSEEAGRSGVEDALWEIPAENQGIPLDRRWRLCCNRVSERYMLVLRRCTSGLNGGGSM